MGIRTAIAHFVAVIVACTASCVAAPPVADDGSGTVSLILQWMPQAQFAGYYVAEEKGFFQRRGARVEVVRGGPDRDSREWVATGRVQFGTNFLTGGLAGRNLNIPLVNIGQIVNRSTLMLVAWKKSGVRSLADLDGRRITVWDGDFRAQYSAAFKAAGIAPRIVAQYYTPNLFLRGGADACAAMHYNEYNTIYLAGVDEDEVTPIFMRDAGAGLPEDGIYCLEATASAMPRTCSALRLGALDGWEWARDHRDEALDITMQRVNEANLPTNRVHMKWMLDRMLESIFPDRATSGRRASSRAPTTSTPSESCGNRGWSPSPHPTRHSSGRRRPMLLRRLKITTRMTLMTAGGAGLILAAVMAYSYLGARDLLQSELEAKARAIAESTANRIDTVGRSVEKIVQGLAFRAESAIETGGDLTGILKQTVEANEEVFGAALALAPELATKRGGWRSPYVCRAADGLTSKGSGRGQLPLRDMGLVHPFRETSTSPCGASRTSTRAVARN